ncbi:MAG: SEL1-like repeat protein [Bacteroidota bacterium]
MSNSAILKMENNLFISTLLVSILFFLGSCKTSDSSHVTKLLKQLSLGNYEALLPFIPEKDDECFACMMMIFDENQPHTFKGLKFQDYQINQDSFGIRVFNDDDSIIFNKDANSNRLSLDMQGLLTLIKSDSSLIKSLGDCLVDKGAYLIAMNAYEALPPNFSSNSLDLSNYVTMAEDELRDNATTKDGKAMLMLGKTLMDRINMSMRFQQDENLQFFDTTHIYWLKESYKAQEYFCSFFLGDIFDKGIGVERNTVEAIKWYFKSLPVREGQVVPRLIHLLGESKDEKFDAELIETLTNKARELSENNALFWRELAFNFGQGLYDYPKNQCLEICALERAFTLGNQDVFSRLMKLKRETVDCQYTYDCGIYSPPKN